MRAKVSRRPVISCAEIASRSQAHEECNIEVVIVAYGFEYLVMAVNAARFIRRTNPGLTVRLITNAPASWSAIEREFDHVHFREDDAEQNRYAKIRSHRFAEAERVLYLDADSEVLGDLTPAFDLLGHFDVLLRPFELPSKFAFALTNEIHGTNFPLFMGGILFFRRNPAAIALFERWEDRYSRSGLARDQPALARAVLDTPEARILPMNTLWGTFSQGDGSGPATWPGRPSPRIYHYADLSNDPAVLGRCAQVLDELLPALPDDAKELTEVQDMIRRVSRLRSFGYRWRVTRNVMLRWWLLRDRMVGREARSTRTKQSRGSGRSLGSDNQPFWDD